MSAHEHTYDLSVTWTGNQGTGTSSYAGYARDHAVTAAGPTPVAGSADPAFRGDPARWNPSSCSSPPSPSATCCGTSTSPRGPASEPWPTRTARTG